jgi:hypothetical protein
VNMGLKTAPFVAAMAALGSLARMMSRTVPATLAHPAVNVHPQRDFARSATVSRWVNNTRITEVDVTVDATKLHYRSEPHSSCSMSKVGTYPDGMTIQQVRKEVNGTFGGRFDSFGDGKFRFIAYTD